MTVSISPSELAASVVSEVGGTDNQVDMMIGIGLVKDSDAVFFQYLGDEQPPAALMMPSGKPCTRMGNVVLNGISVVDGVGEFNSTKLNLFISSQAGRTLMLTSGLTTIWSQCLITSLMGMFNEGTVAMPFNLDTWKGTSKMKPCFASIRQNGVKLTDQMMYDQLRDLRSDKALDQLEAVMRDAVEILNGAVNPSVETVVVAEESADEQIKTLPVVVADF